MASILALTAPTNEVVGLGSAAGLFFGSRGGLSMKAAAYGSVSGVLSDWQLYALALTGGLGFVLGQVSLGTGRLAPSVATVSVANPIVSLLLAVILLQERLARPAWHVVVALIGLGLALAGAVVISLARERAKKPELAPSTS
jgi:uncharacterized membrane protein